MLQPLFAFGNFLLTAIVTFTVIGLNIAMFLKISERKMTSLGQSQSTQTQKVSRTLTGTMIIMLIPLIVYLFVAKITSNIANQLDKVIFELWSIAVNSSDFDHFYQLLRSAVLEIDPCSIPTSWRLKGICHSADPSDYEDALSNSSPSVHSHF
ncbi:hypothetical protein GCK72_016844 [Caenorhabditis remanei]|uniref:Uncharacterized protein n=1 Tax=Caenorhabditis remanei TaxID=31234 RepID=A0A6A5G5Z4_CAERE|nr:hypothetical protein GCK72_016844 [Caenorhabditis remanei]KAF1750296.1 hypothetical protein GCK72_016844 [Caenorhabditis remanei]